MKKVAIIVPVYNEEKNVPLLYRQLCAICAHINEIEWKFIFVDDGSSDASWSILTGLAMQDNRIEALSFSRNFGYQMALLAGYDAAVGVDACITMDADLQHPPHVIGDLIKKWQEGYAIVYAQRTYRKESFLRKVTGNFYYKLLQKVAEVPLPADVSDFRLIDAAVHKIIMQCRDREPYLRGTIAWAGFSHTFVFFDPVERLHGVSGYNWKKLFKLAFDGITQLSRFPLMVAAYVGVFVIITATLMLSYLAYNALFYETDYLLFKWLIVVVYGATGVQFLLMWLLGEYIGRIYIQLRDRPLYVIQSHIKNSDEEIQKAVQCVQTVSERKSL